MDQQTRNDVIPMLITP